MCVALAPPASSVWTYDGAAAAASALPGPDILQRAVVAVWRCVYHVCLVATRNIPLAHGPVGADMDAKPCKGSCGGSNQGWQAGRQRWCR